VQIQGRDGRDFELMRHRVGITRALTPR
jgi:hypothetical protein